jgi:hypothetical protein
MTISSSTRRFVKRMAFALPPSYSLTSASVRYRMKIGGQITGFAQVTKPYVLRDGAAKAFNKNRKCSLPVFDHLPTDRLLYTTDVSDSLQNLILQHSSIDTFLKHYLDRNINVDVQNIYRGLEPQRALIRFACSMSRSIDPRRPWKLTPQQSRSVNHYPCIVKLQKRVDHLYGAPKGSKREKKYQKAVRRLRNEKQRQRN